jgi:hypothetical protein
LVSGRGRVICSQAVRLGDILREEGVVAEADLDQALRSQRGLGGRLGTNLIENGATTGDQIALALARQKGVPAARRKHFEAADPNLRRIIPKFLAERHNAIPIAMATRFGRELVVAFIDPDNIATVEAIAEVAGMRIRPSVAPEFYIINYLERLYGIPPRRFLRAPPIDAIELEHTPPEGHRTELWQRSLTQQVGELEPLEPAPARGFGRQTTQERVIDAGWDLPEPTPVPPEALGEQALEPTIAPAARDNIQPAPPALGAGRAIEAMTGAGSKELIGDALVGFLVGAFGGGVVFVVKHDAAIGWRGYARRVPTDALEAISLPLEPASALRSALQLRSPVTGAPDPSGLEVHTRLWSALATTTPAEIAVAPIAIRDRVVNLVYAHAADGGPLPAGSAADLQRVCAAASAAYVALIQRSKAR